MKTHRFALITTSCLLSACTVGPNYVKPDPAMPPSWSSELAGGLKEGPSALAQWWKQFNDPMLDSLIDRAVESNLDLRIAQERVREARSLRTIEAAQGLPTINAGGSYSTNRSSRNSSGFEGLEEFGVSSGSRDFELYQAGFDAGWEIDVFGGIRRSVEAADATIQATEDRRRDALVTLLSEVARNYTELRSFQRRLEIAQSNIGSQRDALQLTETRFNAGLVSELDVAQARALLATFESTVPVFDSGALAAMHRLAVLLGQQPGTLKAELSPSSPIPGTPPEVPVGLPSELLRRRPDIRAAERDLAAANARIGQATAELYPRFFITGDIGLSSTKFSNFFDSNSVFWGLGPSFTWSLFSGGRIRANIQVQDSRTQQALAGYDQTILLAMEEVENAMVRYSREQVRMISLAEAVDANLRAVDLSNQLYTRGLTAFLNVIEAQRDLFVTQDQLVQSEGAVTSNLIALYKALGGGWEYGEPETTTSETVAVASSGR